jgi:hypothetical protein
MAEEAAKEATPKVETPAAEAPAKVKKKKTRPTNCTQSNKRIRRKDWYYRNGKYFANKQCFKLYSAQEAEKVQKAKEAAAASQPVAG